MIIDLTNMSAHAVVDRKARFDFIENTIGFGTPMVTIKEERDRNGDAVKTLTDTGVVIVYVEQTFEIITAYVATMHQAKHIWRTATNSKRMDNKLWKEAIEIQCFCGRC